jgi:cullin-associated NEDD8-dissociated protein 1
LSNLVDALRTTVQSKVNEGAVKQQVERNEEMIRSALRSIAAAAKIPNIESATKFEEFLRTTIMEGPLAAKYPIVVK